MDLFQIPVHPSVHQLHCFFLLKLRISERRLRQRDHPGRRARRGCHTASDLPTTVIIQSSAATRNTRQRTGQRPWQMAACLTSAGAELCLILGCMTCRCKQTGNFHVVWTASPLSGCLLCESVFISSPSMQSTHKSLTDTRFLGLIQMLGSLKKFISEQIFYTHIFVYFYICVY